MNHAEHVVVVVEHRDGSLAVLSEHFEHLLVLAVVPDVRRLLDEIGDRLRLPIRHRQRRPRKFPEEFVLVGDENRRHPARSIPEAPNAFCHVRERPGLVDGDEIEIHHPGRGFGVERQQELDLLAALALEGCEQRLARPLVGVSEDVRHLVRIEQIDERFQFRPVHVGDDQLPRGLRERKEQIAPLFRRSIRERGGRLRRHRDRLLCVLYLAAHVRSS